ncbi:Methylesterase 17 [Sesamum angolense]|uniref:Methylesterase 17 n=1 Tax=Sesamum angolense TaxID=2727404 RepID=A0AAE1T7G9_9LAMI|nr:Methylesterase 17 [Sesamum angolense]
MKEDRSLSNSVTPPPPPPPHFVLVHGLGGGAWCWYKIRCLMENSGYRVSCLDLKGAGMDPTDPNTVLSFNDYNKPLLDFLSSLDDNDQARHSAGGLSLSDAIHKFGTKKIKLAVFVAATMLRSGFVTDQDIKDGVPDLSEFGELKEVYDVGFGLGEDHPPTTMMIKKEVQRKIIYQLSPKEDSTLAAMLLKPGPSYALTTTRFVDSDETDNVPRIYIKTMHDNVIKPEQQEAMIKKWPPADVYVLESDHSPFFSAPFLLFGLLVKAAVAYGYLFSRIYCSFLLGGGCWAILILITSGRSCVLCMMSVDCGFFLVVSCRDCLIFMNSRSPVASAVSCQTGNKNKFLLWILCCFFPRFFGSPVAFVNFLLFKAIVRWPSPSVLI